jgi:hypothetical protein
MGLYLIKTAEEMSPLITDVAVRLKDGRAVAVPAYLTSVRRIYVQYEPDVGWLDEKTILSFKGKKTRFVEPAKKECSGRCRAGGLGLLAVVAIDGKTAICNIPKYAVTATQLEDGGEVYLCGAFRDTAGCEVEYQACLPEGVAAQDVESAR